MIHSLIPPTQVEFVLPKGLLTAEGTLHQRGVMRSATAADEFAVQKDPVLQTNPAQAVLLMLSRVITQLGTLENISPAQLENLFTPDLEYLQTLFNRLNPKESALSLTEDRIGYPLPQLRQEIALISWHFHWSLSEILQLEHRDRRQWVAEIKGILERSHS
jgi:phage FluMu protein gp41